MGGAVGSPQQVGNVGVGAPGGASPHAACGLDNSLAGELTADELTVDELTVDELIADGVMVDGVMRASVVETALKLCEANE